MLRRSLLFVVPLVAVLALHARFLGGEAMVGWDVAGMHQPWKTHARAWNRLALDPVIIEHPHARLFAEQGAPRWNPYTHLGERTGDFNWPFHSYPPARLLYGVLPAWRAKGVSSILHLALAGLFLALYLRWRGHSTGACLAGGLAYALSPLATVWLEASFFHTPIAPWAPLVLWACEAAGRSQRPAHVALAALALGGATLAGHPHHALLLHGLALLTVLFSRSDAAPFWPRRAGLALAVIAGALLVGTARLAPMISEFLDGARQPTPWEDYFATTVRLGPQHLLLAVTPDLFGHPLRGFNLLGDSAQRYANYQEVRLHWGLPVLVLALAGVTRRNRLFAAVAAGAVLFAFDTPLARVLHGVVPGFGSSSPSRTLWLTFLLVPVLAAAGFDRLRAGDRRPLKIALALLGLVVIVAVLVHWPGFVDAVLMPGGLGEDDRARVAERLSREALAPFSRGLPDQQGIVRSLAPGIPVVRGSGREALLLSPTLGPLVLALVTAGAIYVSGSGPQRRLGQAFLVGILLFDLLFSGMLYNPTSSPDEAFPEAPAIAAVRDHLGDGRALMTGGDLKPNSLMPYGLRAVGGYGSMYSWRLAALLAAAGEPAGRQLVAPQRLPAAWRDALSVRVVLLSHHTWGIASMRWKERDVGVDDLERVHVQDGLIVYRNTGALPRARVHPPGAVRLVSDRGAAVTRIRTAGFRPDLEVVLEANTELHPKANKDAVAEPEPPRPARIVIDEPERVVIEVTPGDPRRGHVLVLADGYADGWTARAGSQVFEVEPANVALRAIRLPAGFGGQIELTYTAPGTTAGPWVTLAAICGCLLVFFRQRVESRSNPGRG